MVSRDDEHRNAPIRYSAERLECLIRERRDDPRAIEDVTRVDYDVDLAHERRLKRGGIIREEIVTAPPPVDTRPDRQIEAEVGIGKEKNTDVVARQSGGLALGCDGNFAGIRAAGRPGPKAPAVRRRAIAR